MVGEVVEDFSSMLKPSGRENRPPVFFFFFQSAPFLGLKNSIF